MFLRREEAHGRGFACGGNDWPYAGPGARSGDQARGQASGPSASNEGIEVWDNHPASGQYNEVFGFFRALHDLHLPFAQVAHGGNEVLAGETAIGGHMAQPG